MKITGATPLERPSASLLSRLRGRDTLRGRGLLSDTHGKIKQLYLSCTTSLSALAVEQLGRADVVASLQTIDLPRITSILRQTDADVRVNVAYHAAGGEADLARPLRELAAEFPEKLNLLETEYQTGTWAQDRLYAFNDRHISVRGSTPRTDNSFDSEGLPTMRFALEHLSALGFTICPAPIAELDLIRGADIITADEQVFLGFNALRIPYMYANEAGGEDRGKAGFYHLITDKAKLKALTRFERTGRISGELQLFANSMGAALEQFAGKPVIFAAGYDQPLAAQCDLDMFFTPLGGGLVAVADPTLANETRGRLIGQGFHDHVNRSQDTPTDRFQLKKEEMAGFVDWLKWKGFTVVRVPFFNKLEREPELVPWASYNNVLVEIFADRKRVYMPVYDLPELDDLAARTYAGLGFEVRRIAGIKEIAGAFGALRCSTKVLERA
ncbi:MAG: hypothetical protein WC529_05760 [Candidatus Margulisiibacteriota bacterium]